MNGKQGPGPRVGLALARDASAADGESVMPGCPAILRDCLLRLVEETPALAMASSRKGRLLYMNESSRRILGVDGTEPLLALSLADFYSSVARRTLLNDALPACLDRGYWHGDMVLVARDGTEVPVSQVLMAHVLRQTRKTDLTVFSSIAWDLREQKRTERALRHQATHDALTGLPNRMLLRDRLTQGMRAAERHGHHVAVLFVDLNGFKKINDRCGHEAGDVALRTLARRLARCLRSEDTVARYGGDEFVVVIPDMGGPHEYASVVRRIEAALREPIGIGDRNLVIGASIGIAVCRGDSEDVDDVLRRADSSMYRVKRGRVSGAPSDRRCASADRRASPQDPGMNHL